MKNWWMIALLLSVGFSFAGCAKFAIDTPSAMVELNESSYSNYDYRATTPDGVVVGVRVERMKEGSGNTPVGELEFWAESTQLRLRTLGGYALLDESEVTSANGVDGIQLRFGRDQDDSPYTYWVTLFVTTKFIHAIEAGGRRDLFEAAQSDIETAIQSYQVKR